MDARVDCTAMLAAAIERDDEKEVMKIAKRISTGEFVLSNEPEIVLDYHKVSIPLTFMVNL